MSVCGTEDLASRIYNKCRCSATRVKCSGMHCGNLQTSIIARKESEDERSSTCMHTVSEENVSPQPQSVLESGFHGETVFPAEEEPSVEPKREVDVEDTAIWESEDEHTSAVTNLPFSGADEGNRNVLTPVLDTTSPLISEFESKICIPELSLVSNTIPPSANTVNSSPFVPNIPTEQCGGAMEDISLCVQSELAEHGIRVKDEPAVKTEVLPTVCSSHSESVLEPMHEVWVEEVRSWEADDAMIENDTGVIGNQETTIQDLDVTTAGVSHNQPAVWRNFTIKTFSSSCTVAQINKNVNAQEIKGEGPERNKRRMVQKYKSIDTVDVVESAQHSVTDEDDVEEEEHVMEGQKMMAEMVETVLEMDTAVDQTEAEEDSAPLSESIFKMMGKSSHESPDVFLTVNGVQVDVEELHRKERFHRCDVCNAVFAYRYHLTRHMRMHTGERPFQCEVCGKSFSAMSTLTVHKRKHTGERPFQCDVCKISFSQLGNLIAHKRKHTGERPYQCDVCAKSFSDKSNLTQHTRKHTGERPFQCDVCKMAFTRLAHLTTHMRKHTGEHPFECDVCKMSFSQKGILTMHKRKHTGERPYQCEVCKMAFSHVGNLTAHKRKHTGERPFQCDFCKRSFSHKSTLTIHRRKHTGERPFVCEVCAMTFSDKSNLTQHMRRHTGKRPFQCDVCEMAFNRVGHLNAHMRKHTGERPFQCEVCGRSFSEMSTLTAHKRRHSGERPVKSHV